MNKQLLFLLPCIMFVMNIYAQNVGIGTTSPNSSAMLDVQSTNKGMLVPRIALTAANAATPVTTPADALLVYNTATAGTGINTIVPGFYYWNASANRWNAMKEESTNSSVGFGSWGDCSNNNISEYNPVVDDTGEYGDYFGYSVSISGSYAIAGAYFDNVGANARQGSVSIFQHNGNSWGTMQKITDPAGADNDWFGHSVSISGNYAIVGTPRGDVGGNLEQGSANIYFYNGTSWVFIQKITDPTGVANNWFGYSVSISGNYAIAGTYRDNLGSGPDQGSACIYEYNGTSWVFKQKIIDATGQPGDDFGYSVSIAGNYAIVGAFLDDVGGNANQGSASIYQNNGSSWVLMNKITEAVGGVDDRFGSSVSISGNYAIIGSPYDDVNAVIDKGSAHIYYYNGTAWILVQKITDAAAVDLDYFGSNVAISGDFAMVGWGTDDIGANQNQGSAIIYQRIGLGWQKVQYIIDPAGSAGDVFGSATAIDGSTKRFLNGASRYASDSGKVVFGKVN